MNRVTDKCLQRIVDRINLMQKTPMEPYTKTETENDTEFEANIGNYHLSYSYGGISLYRMVNDGGGVTDVLMCGHVSKRELQTAMFAYIRGLEDATK